MAQITKEQFSAVRAANPMTGGLQSYISAKATGISGDLYRENHQEFLAGRQAAEEVAASHDILTIDRQGLAPLYESGRELSGNAASAYRMGAATRLRQLYNDAIFSLCKVAQQAA